jgi:S-formylglutathione hydrolase FrmB
MAFATIQFFSQALQKASSLNVVFPGDDAAAPRPWAAFYLLHGLSDDHTIWTRRSSIERYVAGLPLVVVMPDGGRGWYSDAVDGTADHETDLVRDVVGLVERTFPVKAERSARAIGGLSMGGYGAVKVGLKHHEMFASVSSHSGAFGIMTDPVVVRQISPEFARVFGPNPAGGPDDPFAIVDRVAHGRLPALRIDCGRDDFLIEHNRKFHRHLNERNIPHEYHEFPGGHDWAYWDEHVREAVAFHARNLKIE